MPSRFPIARFVYGLPLLFASMALVGCGSGVEEEVVPPLQPVHGQVLVDGEPMAGVAVTFVPARDTTGGGGYGTTDASGNYTLKYRNGEPGAPAGIYNVIFSKLVQPDGSPIPEGQSAADVGAVELIPERYRNMVDPLNQVEVKQGDNKFDFEVRS